MNEGMPAIPVNSGRRYYAFIDNARFLAMVFIVMRHCEGNLYGDSPASALESAIVQFRTFRVQLFFVIGGFLMRDWLARNNFNYHAYWRNRMQRVAMPWLIWVTIYICLNLLQSYIRPPTPAISVGEIILRDVFFSTYWFVPVMFVSLAIMLVLRGAWRSWSVGLAFLCLSFLYGVNQYVEWFPSGHTIAFFGYLFFVWVGVRLNDDFEIVSARVQRIGWWTIGVLLGATFALTLVEDWYMNSLGFPDTYNALQLSKFSCTHS